LLQTPQVSNETIAYYAAIERLNNENIKIVILFLANVQTIPEIQVILLITSHFLLFRHFIQIFFKEILNLLPNIDVVIVRDMQPFAYPYLLLSPSGWSHC
jgi:hypothetical protein